MLHACMQACRCITHRDAAACKDIELCPSMTVAVSELVAAAGGSRKVILACEAGGSLVPSASFQYGKESRSLKASRRFSFFFLHGTQHHVFDKMHKYALACGRTERMRAHAACCRRRTRP